MRLRRSKYGAEPTTVEGIRFHSKREATRYQELRLLERAGEIRDLECQSEFFLNASHREQPKYVGIYRADFTYTDVLTGKRVIEDVKGVKTALYKWKKKHVEAQYGIEIREV